MMFSIKRAAEVLLGGGVIAYPTEGVFGLGCLPDDSGAVSRILALKRRDPAKGLIIVAASVAELRGWVAPADLDALPPPDPAAPVTWITRPGPRATPLLRGEHQGLAVRITLHPVARDLSLAVDSPIVSTSANLSGRPVVRNKILLRREFGPLVDYIVPGDCGVMRGPSEIRLLSNGRVLRPTSP